MTAAIRILAAIGLACVLIAFVLTPIWLDMRRRARIRSAPGMVEMRARSRGRVRRKAGA